MQERTKLTQSLCVQLQPIAGRPTRDVEDALRHVGLERAGIRQCGPAVNLTVICVQMRMQTVIGDQRGEIGGVQHKKQMLDFTANMHEIQFQRPQTT